MTSSMSREGVTGHGDTQRRGAASQAGGRCYSLRPGGSTCKDLGGAHLVSPRKSKEARGRGVRDGVGRVGGGYFRDGVDLTGV